MNYLNQRHLNALMASDLLNREEKLEAFRDYYLLNGTEEELKAFNCIEQFNTVMGNLK